MEPQNAEELIEKGRKSLLRGEFHKAAKAFAKALEHSDSPALRNNLAYAHFMAGKHQQALKDLKPLLEAESGDKGPNPFTFALASRACCALGDLEKARQWLEKAIHSFDEGLREIRRSRKEHLPESEAFLEYTAIIMHAAGDIGDHRLVYELFRRWELYHTSWLNAYMAAVACFNLGRYKQAASIWSNLSYIFRQCSTLSKIAFAAERGLIPPFQMDYSFPPEEECIALFLRAAKDKEARKRCVENSFIRALLLGNVLDNQDTPDARHYLYNLVLYGGDWGQRLAESVFKGSIYSIEMKSVAAQALIERGILKPGEPIPMVVDGEEKTFYIEVKTPEIIEGRDEKLDSLVQKAKELRDQGKIDEAIALLEEIYEKGVYYPPAMMTLVNLLRTKKRLKEALNIMEVLEFLAPEDPRVLFTLSALMIELEDADRARYYFQRIDISTAPDEVRAKLPLLESEIKRLELKLSNRLEPPYVSPEQIMAYFTESERKKIEDKPLPVDTTLAKGMKNMPAKWLTAACKAYGLDPVPHRPEREKQLIAFLSDPQNLKKAVSGLTERQRKLLKYLLEQGGWSTISPVAKKFGAMSGDGFFWDEVPPKSALGNLWMRCLVMVGRVKLSDRRYKIVSIPLELREPLKELL